MNVAQNLSAIFNSPQIAEVQLQAVQAGDMALREFEEAGKREALRRQAQVTGSEPSSASGAVDARGRGAGAPPRRPARAPRRPSRQPAAAPAPGSAGADPSLSGAHRIDLVA